jgi:signal transduction histidine kinase
MKLWLKIFLSILILSLSSLFISTYFVIRKNHESNLSREQERSLNELELIKISLESNVDFAVSSKEAITALISRYGEYYEQKGIGLLLYQKNEYLYNRLNTLEVSDYEALLAVKPDSKMAQVLTGEDGNYILVSDLLSEKSNTVLLYSRNINEIYDSRNQSIRLTLYLSVILSLLLGIFSYLYTRFITRPFKKLQRSAAAISEGNYSIRLEETDKEFTPVAAAFNQMIENVGQHTRELENRAKERQEFIDDLSHEMNTPLTSIQGYSEFLLTANATEEQRYLAAQSINKDARRMREMYTKLMNLTFIREHAMEIEEFSVDELVNSVKESLFLSFKEQGIQFITENQIKEMKGDKTLLEMLLTNLLHNSQQAISSGGRVIFRAYMEGAVPTFKVEDNGCGIPKDKINEIIKPFVRVDKSRSRKTGGAGLGLALVQRIASLHQAKLIIESEFSKGTQVILQFPEAESVAAAGENQE